MSVKDELLSQELASRMLEVALSKGAQFAELFIEERISHAVSLDARKIDRNLTGVQKGVGVRVICDDSTGYAFSENFSPESLIKAAEMASTVANRSLSGHHHAGNASTPELESFLLDPDLVHEFESKEARVERLLEADEIARLEDPRIQQVTVFYGTIHQKIQVINSLGKVAEDERKYLRFRVQAVAKDSTGRLAVGTHGPGVTQGTEFFKETTVKTIAKRAVRQAINQLEAVEAPSAEIPVILCPGVGGVFIHEAIGHGVEGDSILRNSSIFADKLGKKVASDIVTIYDDSTVPGSWGSFGCDDEGTSASKTTIVNEGRLEGFLADQQTAGKLGCPPTGNGRRASFRHLPVTRMTNTYIANGKEDPDDIIRDTPYGFYVASVSGGSVDPVTGQFEFTVREGFLIRNGKLSEPVQGAILVGNCLEALMNIDRVGNDLQIVAANCGKDGQKAFVGLGQPTVRIRRLFVGGTKRR